MKLQQTKMIQNNQGFTLIEILVALVLVTVVMGLAISNPFSGNQALETEVKNIKRAITYIADESSIRNTITRIHFYLDKDPQEYAAEYGPSSQFVLPADSNSEDISILTKEEEEKKTKEAKNLNAQFNKMTDFQESNNELDQSIKVIAFGNSNSKTLQTKGEISIYSYPSGEKDEVFIALIENDTLATITTQAFSTKITHNYYHLNESDEKDVNIKAEKKVKELFDTWFSGKK